MTSSAIKIKSNRFCLVDVELEEEKEKPSLFKNNFPTQK